MGNSKLMNFLKYLIPFLFLFFLSMSLLIAILNRKNDFKIEEGDIVKHCVIDSMFVTDSPSTIEPGNRYHYRTNCGQTFVTRRNDVYKIGDTLTFVYKKISK